MTERLKNSRPAWVSTAALAALAILTWTVTASAQSDGRPGSPAQRRACTPDVYRFCAGEIPSVAKITACLRRKKASLSPDCAAVFEQ